jgi:hypothetical protein
VTDHLIELNPSGVNRLRKWLGHPGGTLTMGQVTFEAVTGGGILVRTRGGALIIKVPDRPLCLEMGCPNPPAAGSALCTGCKADTTRGPLYARPHRPLLTVTGTCEVCGRDDFDGIHQERDR